MVKRFFVLAYLLFKFAAIAFAQEPISGTSAQLSAPFPVEKNTTTSAMYELAKKRLAVSRVLQKYQSPLSSSVDTFIKVCSDFEFDCYFLPAISGLESYFGWFVAPGTYNPFGWDSGRAIFASWDESIFTVGQGIRQRYVSQDEVTPFNVGPTYAESPTWAVRVARFMSEFEAEEAKIPLTLSGFELEL